MADEEGDERWPFTTPDQLLDVRSHDPGVESATTALVDAAAAETNVEPLALSPLHYRIDPDCIEPLLVETSGDAPDGVRLAVEVSFDEVSVLLRDDGYLTTYETGRGPTSPATTPAVDHDWSSPDPLLWSIGRAVGDESGVDAATVTERLVEWTDADAVNRLLRPLPDGSERSNSRLLLSLDGYEVAVEPDGSITVEPTLAVLKRAGAALLVVGSLPEPEFDRVSTALLGGPGRTRAPVFVLHGRNVETARRRLSTAGLAPSTSTVVEHRVHARAASDASSQPSRQELDVVSVSDSLQALPDVVRETIANTAPVSPGELRLGVDSLSAMIASTDLETTRDVVEPLCRTVREHRGVGHFLLPGDPERDDVEALAPSFDAVVEVRTGDAGIEQRWRLTGTGHETGWFPLE